MAEAIFQKPLNKRIKRLIDGLTYQAVKSGNNWILPSGTNAAAGEYITVDGVLGQATAAIVGGTDAIVENTNWAPEGTGGAINALNSKINERIENNIRIYKATSSITVYNGYYALVYARAANIDPNSSKILGINGGFNPLDMGGANIAWSQNGNTYSFYDTGLGGTVTLLVIELKV